MLEKIIDNYGDFGDALIVNLQYSSGYDYSTSNVTSKSIEITISCFNKKRNYESDLIKIYCKEITHFNLKKHDGMIFMGLLEELNSEFTLDFFPHFWENPNGDGIIAKENLNSECIIKCKSIFYEVVDKKASS